MSCEDIPSLLDLQNTKKHIDDFDRLMGMGTGTSTNEVTGQVRPTYNKVIKDMGFKPGSGDFTTGFTVMPGERDIAWYDPVSKNWYSYLGTIPSGGYGVAPGTNPVGDVDWKPVTDELLRSDLINASNQSLGDALVAVKQPFPNAIFQTQHEFNVPIRNVFSWGVVADGAFTGDADAMQACLDDLKAAYPAGAAVYMPPGEYRFNKTIIIPDRINIFGDGAGTQIRPIGALLGDPTASIFRFDYGPSTNGAFMRDLTITGDDIVKGIDTTLQPTDAVIRQVYALNFSGITVQNCAVGYEMQGWWHSSMRDCRAGGCNVGLRLLGQCVSIHIDACKFSSKGLAQPTSVGIDVRPSAYTWSGGNTVCSESIIIDGETMCIGVNVGIWAVESLHMHIDKVTLDFIGATGLILERNNATFSMQNTWIAAQADSTKQFIGVDLRGQSPAVQRTFSGLEIRCNNANPINNNIGISLGNSVANVNIKKSSISGGSISVYGKTSRAITMTDNFFDKVVHMDDVDFLDISNNDMLNGLTLLNSPVTRSLNIGFNRNVSTRGLINVPISGGGTTGSIGIPSPVPGVLYGVKTICVDGATGKDTASISGTTITVNRPTPVGPAVSSLVEYFIVGN